MTETKQLYEQMPEEESAYKPLKELNLLDDFLFDVTTMDLDACKIIIELSLGMTLKSIKWKEGQKVVHNLPGKRGIRMDFCVEDGEGNFIAEAQRGEYSKAHPLLSGACRCSHFKKRGEGL